MSLRAERLLRRASSQGHQFQKNLILQNWSNYKTRKNNRENVIASVAIASSCLLARTPILKEFNSSELV